MKFQQDVGPVLNFRLSSSERLFSVVLSIVYIQVRTHARECACTRQMQQKSFLSTYDVHNLPYVQKNPHTHTRRV